MVGRTISHYRIVEKIGEGGMGIVYKAEDTKLKRPVALKFLAAHLLNDAEVRARFTREAEAAAALNHPNICTVHEIDEVEGKTFIVMAFIEGDSLEQKIEAGPLKLKDALDVAVQTAQGLQAAHEKKIVHRDIKPANLMITGEGAKQLVTIMDFGLALLTDRSKLTKSGTTLGTPIYMSPEQAQGEESDHHTDIWSLGVVLYEMVVGRAPFRGDYEQAVVYSILNEEPEPLTALRTGVPMELERIVGKCMAKEIEERYQHTDDPLLDLQTLKKKLESGKSAISRSAPAGSVGARPAVPAAPEETTGTRAQHAVPLHSPADASEQTLAKYKVIEEVRIGHLHQVPRRRHRVASVGRDPGLAASLSGTDRARPAAETDGSVWGGGGRRASRRDRSLFRMVLPGSSRRTSPAALHINNQRSTVQRLHLA